ncbi:hypothetical protein MK280_18185 [Myxococcota bacterium]|nr:hypothetical protein [Myxococcota bacterium]
MLGRSHPLQVVEAQEFVLYRAVRAIRLVLPFLFLVPNPADAAAYDAVVDVTGLTGRAACEAMQAAINPALEGRGLSRRVLIQGQLGTPSRPVDYRMFHNEGKAGTSGRAWPYGVCHAFWPIPDSDSGSAIVNGYPDPLRGRVVTEGVVTAQSTASTLTFRDRLCRQFSIDRKLAVVKSG